MRPVHYTTDGVDLYKVCVGPLENNAYLLVDRETEAAVLVDAAAEPETLLDLLDGRSLRAILTTHGHWDHVGAAAAMAEATGAPVHVHPADAERAGLAEALPIPARLEVGAIRLDAIPIPGHTPGSTVFRLDGAVLTGDTLFPGGPGKTPDEDAFEEILSGIEAHLFTLDDDTLVFPGHGLDTTIGAERPNLAAWRVRGW